MSSDINRDRMPLVSVIVPCYNEESTIGLLLDALYGQTFPQEEMEVVIADGLSTDRTCDIIETYKRSKPEINIRVVDNKQRTIPAGINTAIRAASGEFIVRLDAHSVPDQDYVSLCAKALRDDKGENVGGVWEIRPGGASKWAQSIAVAASHPLGVGDARYRWTDQSGYVDTVPFGAFKKDLIDRIGGFDENLLTNEDYEFNARILLAGGKIWLDPKIRSVYFARSSLAALGRQYWRYGYWKARMLQRYPKTLRWRQALPPLFVLSLIILSLLALFFPIVRWFLVFQVVLYNVILFSTGLYLGLKNHKIWYILGVPAAIAVMHLAWGSGFLWSVFEEITSRK
jgi:glycosyltransferase involved in cell wall biosynthesis